MSPCALAQMCLTSYSPHLKEGKRALNLNAFHNNLNQSSSLTLSAWLRVMPSFKSLYDMLTKYGCWSIIDFTHGFKRQTKATKRVQERVAKEKKKWAPCTTKNKQWNSGLEATFTVFLFSFSFLAPLWAQPHLLMVTKTSDTIYTHQSQRAVLFILTVVPSSFPLCFCLFSYVRYLSRLSVL